jgi:hypothetical protein
MSHGKSQFRIIFTRYQNGERVMSTPQDILANDFNDAVKRATDRLFGMSSSNPDARFDIASIEGAGYTGVDAYGYINDIFRVERKEEDA